MAERAFQELRKHRYDVDLHGAKVKKRSSGGIVQKGMAFKKNAIFEILSQHNEYDRTVAKATRHLRSYKQNIKH
jgi:hypothetical protein